MTMMNTALTGLACLLTFSQLVFSPSIAPAAARGADIVNPGSAWRDAPDTCVVEFRVTESIAYTERSPMFMASAVWDGMDKRGNTMATGVCFYRMVAGEVESSRKMLLLE